MKKPMLIKLLRYVVLLLCGLASSTALVAAPKPSFEGAWWGPGMTPKNSGNGYEPDFILFQRGNRICGFWTYFATTRTSGYVQAKVRPGQPNLADWTYICGFGGNSPYHGIWDCPRTSDISSSSHEYTGWVKATDGPFLLCGKHLYGFYRGSPIPAGKNLCRIINSRPGEAGPIRRPITRQLLKRYEKHGENIKHHLAECLAGKDPAPAWIRPATK